MVLLENDMRAYHKLDAARKAHQKYLKYVKLQEDTKAEKIRCLKLCADWHKQHRGLQPAARTSQYWLAKQWAMAHPKQSYQMLPEQVWLAQVEANEKVIADPETRFEPVAARSRRNAPVVDAEPATGAEAGAAPAIVPSVLPSGPAVLHFTDAELAEYVVPDDDLEVNDKDIALNCSQSDKKAMATAEKECIGNGFPANDRAFQKMREQLPALDMFTAQVLGMESDEFGGCGRIFRRYIWLLQSLEELRDKPSHLNRRFAAGCLAKWKELHDRWKPNLWPWLLTTSFFHPAGLNQRTPAGYGYEGWGEVEREVINRLVDEMDEEMQAAGEEAGDNPLLAGMPDFERRQFLKETPDFKARALTARQEVEAFCAEKEKLSKLPQFAREDPMAWWMGKLEVWPHLAARALAALSRPLTSVATERYFSTMNWIVGMRRTRLLTSHVAALAKLKRNAQEACDMKFKGKVDLEKGKKKVRRHILPDVVASPDGYPAAELLDVDDETWLAVDKVEDINVEDNDDFSDNVSSDDDGDVSG
jgi:hypothetical protein